MARWIREPFNAVSHLVGAFLAVIGLIYLLYLAQADARAVAAFAIYGTFATLLFAASTTYHWSYRGGDWLQKFDHTAIYLMIAGTYTPVCLLGLPEPMGWIVLGIEWALAAIGVTATLAMRKPPAWLRLLLYLAMGWMVLPLIGVLSQRISNAGLAWTIAGGLAYTVGTVVYASQRPNPWPGRFGSHEIWHLFVLAGGVCHFVVMVILARMVAT